MRHDVGEKGRTDLDAHGLAPQGTVHWNLAAPALYEHALAAGDGRLAQGGPLVVSTGRHTGRQPKDKFAVREPGSEGRVWWGSVNVPIEQGNADIIGADLRAHLSAAPNLYVVDSRVGAHPEHGINVRVVTESAWHALFAQTMFIDIDPATRAGVVPDSLILHAPSFDADPARHGTRATNFVTLDLTKREVNIGGTYYAGEIKKSAFTLMNDLMPLQGVLPMHCSANVGADGHVAVFFGLSGTGKTTLSTDSERPLIGDDEHGWADDGVFNFEGGCYAKVIGLSEAAEPEIFATTRMFGTVLENVVMDDATRVMDLDDDSLTENTRGAYPLTSIPNAVPSGRAGHPAALVMLTADAFGVLPPVAKLTPEEAMHFFLAGYTARVAGTEVGVKEPQATFSSCFGAVFLPQPPTVYGEMLKQRLERYDVSAFLVNTGWTGGPYGEGHRMPIKATRAIIRAALSGALDGAPSRTDPNFGFQVPTHIEGVEDGLLDPRSTWADPAAYDARAAQLAKDISAAAANPEA
ncbi:MAG: phosphoenolpyruvate carboxykinase (ATP) [Thermoleophilia bacterium]